MLQFLPALLLLMMQGPASLNRGVCSASAPEAIRMILELRHSEDEAELQSALDEANELAAWLTSTSGSIELSTALAHFLGLDALSRSSDSKATDLCPSVQSLFYGDPPTAESRNGSFRAHPCRAGPSSMSA